MRASPSVVVLVSFGIFACGSVKSDPPATTDGPVVDASVDAPPAAATRFRWTFDGTTNNTGAVNGFALATPGGISYVAGKVGLAASFGSGQYATVSGTRAQLGSYAKVTIAFWLREPGNLSSVVFDCNKRAPSAPYGGIQIALSSTSVPTCVSTTTASLLGASCVAFPAPAANTWHHWIVRYDGTGTGAGQGAPTEFYIDDVLVHTRQNDSNNDPVFNPTGTSDILYVGSANMQIDDVQIYDRVFTRAEQCTQIIGGTFASDICTLP